MYSLCAAIRAFASNERGNVVMIFAIVLVPMISAIGCAVDYTSASTAYSKLLGCADSAILSAVSSSGMAMTSKEAESSMLSWFNASCPLNGPQLSNVSMQTFQIKAVDTNGVRAASIDFLGNRKNDFLNVVGFPKTDIKGGAKGTSATPTFIDIYSLLDISPSMGLAATASEQARLKSLTPDTCEFACHEIGAKSDNYRIARKNSVQLRVDVLRDSWISLIQQAKNDSGLNVFRFATNTFDRNMNVEQMLTGSYSLALATASNIDLAMVPSSGPGSSYADEALSTLTLSIPSGGDGSSFLQTKKYVLFVTDGVQDIYNCGATWCHQTQTVTSLACQALKNKSVSVAVIYTKYLPMTNVQYTTLVQPFENQISSALQACATPGLYFQADQASDISAAFDAIFTQIKTKARLTN